jgi:hypothetical protein
LDGGSARHKAYTYKQNNTNRINAHNRDIHALSEIRTHDHSVRAGEDSSYLRLRGHCDRFVRQYFFSIALSAHSGPRPLIQFRNRFSQTVGLLGRVMSPSQGRYLNTGQHKQKKRTHALNIHALSRIGTHDPSVRASEDSSRLRPRGYCDRLFRL